MIGAEEWRARLMRMPLRYIAAGAAACCIAACVLYASQSAGDAAVIEHPAAERIPPPETRREIAGLDAASERTPLHNPFTYAHETRGAAAESAHTATAEKAPAAPALPAGAGAQSAAQPVHTPPETPPVQSRPVLRGTVTGADGRRIAIVASDKDSAALSVGEMWRDYTVEDVGDTAVTLRRGGETVTLRRE